jgi:hypothetical protein
LRRVQRLAAQGFGQSGAFSAPVLGKDRDLEDSFRWQHSLLLHPIQAGENAFVVDQETPESRLKASHQIPDEIGHVGRCDSWRHGQNSI